MQRPRSKSECTQCVSSEFCYYHGLDAFGIQCTMENTALVVNGLPALDQGLEGCEGFETIPGICHHIDLVCEPANREAMMSLIVNCVVSASPDCPSGSLESLGQLLSFTLSFLNSLQPTLTNTPQKEFACLCPDQHCPIFLLRLFSGSSVLIKALGPLLRSPDPALVCLALKFSWRLYHIVQYCLPRCSRYKMLALMDSPARLGHFFWLSLLREACSHKEIQEAVFECVLELLVDRTELAPELDAEGRLTKVDLFCRDIKNPLFFAFAFEPLQHTSLEFQMLGMKHLFSALLGKCSSVGLYDLWVCPDHQLGVLKVLSLLSLQDCSKDPNAPELIHYGCGFFTNILTSSLQSIAFPSIARQTMTTLCDFGPSGSNCRRVNVIRHVLHAALAALRDDVGMMTRDTGGVVWINFMYLALIVLHFVLFVGYETRPNTFEHFPTLEDLMQPMFLPPPSSTARRMSMEVSSRPWRATLSGPVRLHLAVRPASGGHGSLGTKDEKWEVLAEDIELLQKLDGMFKGLGLYTEVDVNLYRGEKAVCQALKRGHQLSVIVQGLLQILAESGASLKANAALELRNPRQKRRSALLSSAHPHLSLSVYTNAPVLSEDDLKAAERPPNYEQQVEFAQQDKTKEMVRKLVLAIDSMLVSKDAKTVFKELNREELETADPLRVIHEGPLILCNGIAGRQPEPVYMKLCADALLYAPRESWLRGEHPHVIPLLAIKQLQMDVPFVQPETAEEKTENLFFFAVVSKVESFILADLNQQTRDEWVNLISVGMARARLENRGQGECLEGLYVLASSSFKASPLSGRIKQSASGTLYSYRQIMVPGSRRHPTLKKMASDYVPLYTDQPFCCQCKTNFTFFNRRQHCARCGKGFCPKCVSRAHGQIFKLPKVCVVCFEELKKKEAESKKAALEHGAKSPEPAVREMPKRMSGLSMAHVFKPRASLSRKT